MKESQLEYIGLTRSDWDFIIALLKGELKSMYGDKVNSHEFEIMVLKELLKKIEIPDLEK